MSVVIRRDLKDLRQTNAFLIIAIIFAVVTVGAAVGAIDMASWSFTLYYLAGAIVLGAVVFYLSRLLTKEKIILSSKGG